MQTESYIKLSFENWFESIIMAREDLEEFRLSKLPVVKPKSLP